MKAVISILIIVVVCFGAWKLNEYYTKVSQEDEAKRQAVAAAANIKGEQLPGLPYQLEPSLQKAQQDGVKALKQWLETYRRSPLVKDPRLAWIELDYVLLIKGSDPGEAKRVFADVKSRTQSDSPIYHRIKLLEKTFE